MTHTDKTIARDGRPDPLRRYRLLARVQGALNVLGGAWPLLHLRSFEAVFGPKDDTWLVHTVAGLLVANGWAQLRAASAAAGLARARDLGLGTALTLLAIDVVYVTRGRLRWTYLLDAAVEAVWVVGWSAAPAGPGLPEPTRLALPSPRPLCVVGSRDRLATDAAWSPNRS